MCFPRLFLARLLEKLWTQHQAHRSRTAKSPHMAGLGGAVNCG
ncbi:hypothetical protein [Polaromonas sp. CG9_12]|nr:hypothetical protein [Polaromonas sp. CG9_12]